MKSAEEWARIATGECPQKLPEGTPMACEDCIAEVARAYAREAIEAWRDEVVRQFEAGDIAHVFTRISAAIRALPVELP